MKDGALATKHLHFLPAEERKKHTTWSVAALPSATGQTDVAYCQCDVLFALMLGTMMIPFPVVMVGLFSIFRFIGDHTPFQTLGTLRPLWIGAFFANAFNVFLLRQFFLTVP